MTANRAKIFSKSSHETQATPAPKFNIVLLGDSTIDNKIWVYPGIYGNGLMNKLGIHGASPRTRVKRSHGLFSFGTELSVVENLMDMLPQCRISDFTNDGFTTSDLLMGNFKDKVFPRGAFHEFPHDLYEPLQAAKKDISEANYIVLSVGGNNFREFLQHSFRITDPEKRMSYIKKNFPALVEETKVEYGTLLKRVLEMNPNASLVLMTQYYPSFVQNDYRIYDFMSEVGSALHPEAGDTLKPQDVIQDLVKQLYSSVLTAIQPYSDRLVVADLTSSLNPHDPANHVKQIEPSGVGGRRIASMLSYLMTQNVNRGQIYQFDAPFFTTKDTAQAAQHVKQVTLDQWTPKHPDAFMQEKTKSTLRIK